MKETIHPGGIKVRDVHGAVRAGLVNNDVPDTYGYVVTLPDAKVVGVWGRELQVGESIVPEPDDPDRKIVFDNREHKKPGLRSPATRAYKAVIRRQNRETWKERFLELWHIGDVLKPINK